MADVQLEKGYLRIATELMDEILRRDFSKRQLAILHLIIRLSYGCHRKDCVIEKLIDFEIVGIYKQDTKKELNYLVDTKVIDWDRQQNIFSLNKNYEIWQINPTKGWDKPRLDRLLHNNIKGKKVSKTLTSLNLVVSKTLTEIGETVSKTLTDQFVKHLLELFGNDWESRSEEVLKDSIKDIYLKIKDKDDDIKVQPNYFTEYEKAFGYPPALLISDFHYWIDSEETQFTEPEEIIIEVIHRAKKQIPRNPAKYVSKILKDLHNMELYTLEAVKEYNKKFDEKMSGGAKVDGKKGVHQYRRGSGRSTSESKEPIFGDKIGRY